MRVTKYNTLVDKETKLPYLVKEKALNFPAECRCITFPKQIVKMLDDLYNFSQLSEECVYELCYTCAGSLLGIFEISRGTLQGTMLDNREILMKALLCNAGAIVIVRNRPSGVSYPSTDDLNTYHHIKKGCEIMDVTFMDYIIVGDNYYSVSENSN